MSDIRRDDSHLAMDEDEQKSVALDRILDAWDDALGDGCEPELIATAAIFAALSDMVDAYGENAVAEMAETLPERIRGGEFSMRQGDTH